MIPLVSDQDQKAPTMTATSPSRIDRLEIWSYHAHIYFSDDKERAAAALLREEIAHRFSVQLGRWHDRMVGPHTKAMYQVAFATGLFALFVPWLMQNRRGLTVLVHPNTGWPRDDHQVHALWLGEVLAINGDVLPVQNDPGREDVVEANTKPLQGVVLVLR